MRCEAEPLGGGQCELDAGHELERKHEVTTWQYDYQHPENPPRKTGTFEWSDESQKRLADRHGSRFD